MTLVQKTQVASRSAQALPANNIRGQDWYYYMCGGRGGGGLCAIPQTYDHFWWAIKVSPYSVYNRHLVLQNNAFQVWYDGGVTVSCPDSYGAASSYVLYLSYTAPTTKIPPNITYSLTVPSTQVLPNVFNFDSGLILPQPNNVNYDGHIYVTVSLPQANMVTNLFAPATSANTSVMVTTNLDFDSRL